MHHSRQTRRSHAHRWAPLALLCALALLGAAQLAPAALAARANYTGAPSGNALAVGDIPVYVPNDYTVSALRFSASGLLDAAGNPAVSGTQYYVKIRLSPLATPQGDSNRGFTWNPTTTTWVQERDADWTKFPIVTAGTGGTITAGNTWYFFRFGDTTKAGTYYVLVSLQPVGGGTGTTQNNDSPPAVTVLDMTGSITGAEAGLAVHNGVATGVAGKRAEADLGGGAAVWALTRTEPTGVADNGTAGTSGNFVLGVPTGKAFDVRLQNVIWPTSALSFTGSQADVNIALGATDTTPPSAPGTLTVTPGDSTAALSWGAATDDTGVSGYSIYRWTDPPAGSGYTSQPVDVHDTPDGSTTTWTDNSVTNGTTYHYSVRANDTATNVGPRSNTVDALPQAPSALSLVTSARTVAWGGKAVVSGTVSSVAGLAAQSVKLQSSVGGGAWTAVKTLTSGANGHFSTSVTPTQATRYRAVFDTNAAYVASTSVTVTVTPMVKLGMVSAPSKVKKGRSFSVSGSLTPRMKAGSKTVKVKCYLKKGGKWTLKKTSAAKNSNSGSASKYKASIRLGTKGSWRLVAYSPKTSKYAATTANAKNITVK